MKEKIRKIIREKHPNIPLSEQEVVLKQVEGLLDYLIKHDCLRRMTLLDLALDILKKDLIG